MANSNRNNTNRWDGDRNYNDHRDSERSGNYERESRRNTSMHQGSWNGRGGSNEENYGLGDTSQGSENYGHIDHGHGARFYGTGNYGGYFGRGSDQDSEDWKNEGRRSMEGRKNYSDNRGSDEPFNSGNYGKGPRYGNSNIHGRYNERGSSYNGTPGFGKENQSSRVPYGSRDWNRGNSERYSRYDDGRRGGDWDNDRDWWDKTSDEISSWFGDEDAERRRELDRINGPHSGKGPKGYTRSDEKIKEDIEEKLYNDSFIDATDIEVTVQEGEVTLSGTVDNKQTKRRAEDCADRVSGVKDVSNHLKTYRSTTPSSSEIGSLNKGNTTSGLSEKDQKLDQSKDLNRAQ